MSIPLNDCIFRISFMNYFSVISEDIVFQCIRFYYIFLYQIQDFIFRVFSQVFIFYEYPLIWDFLVSASIFIFLFFHKTIFPLVSAYMTSF